MLGKRLFWAGALMPLAVAALAHNGATGVVMDRMMGMSAMKDIMAQLAPMMRGEVPFEVRTVQENAARIMGHSGDAMTRLFPQGSLQAVSYAKPEIWEEWEDFDALSEQLKAYAFGLAMAAPNGLTAPSAVAGAEETMDHSTMAMEMSTSPGEAAEGMMDHGGMRMDAAPETMAPEVAAPIYSVAELMGVALPPVMARATSGSSMEETVDFAMMAADDAFDMVSQTCSSCHARFRTGD